MKVKKSQLAKVIGKELLILMKSTTINTDAPYPATNKARESSQKKNSPNAKQKKNPKVPKPATVEEAASSDDEEDFGAAKCTTRQAKTTNNPSSSAGEFVKLMESTPATIGDLENWMADRGLGDEETVKMVEERCGNLAKLIRMSKIPKTVSNRAGLATLEEIDEFFVHKNNNRTISILYPLEIFKAKPGKGIPKNKVFGFIRSEGNPRPLMYSISGYTEYFEANNLLLDSDEWSQQTFRFGVFHGHRFRTDPYEGSHGKVSGATTASHVEPKLMLFYACRLLGKFCREFRTIEAQLGRLYKLKEIVQKMKSPPTAEVLLSRAPCTPCKQFQALLEDVSGVKFTVKVCNVLARVMLEKDRYGKMVYPTCGDDSESEDATHRDDLKRMLIEIEGLKRKNRKLKELPMVPFGDSDSEESAVESLPKSRVQVVIPIRRLTDSSAPRTPKKNAKSQATKTTTQNPIAKVATPSSSTKVTTQTPITKVTTTSPTAKVTTTKTTHHTSKVTTLSTIDDIQKRGRKRGYISEDDEDYELPGLHRHRSSSKRKSPRSGHSSPGDLRHEFELIDLETDVEEEFGRVVQRQESFKTFKSAVRKLTYGQ